MREADKEKDGEIKILQKANKRLMNDLTEKDAQLGKREKNRVYNEKKYNVLAGSVRKFQERVESQSIKITKMQTETDGLRGNLVEAKNQLKNAREESANAKRKQAAAEKRCEAHKRSLVDAEKTRLDDQAIHASCLQNMEEAHEGIIQRKCDEVEGRRKRIEEKETMDAAKAAADAAEAKAKEEDKMIEDYDVMQEVMEEEKVVGMEPTVIEEDNESRSGRSAAEAAEHLCVVVDDEAEDRRAVSDDEDKAAGDGRDVPDVKEEEEHEGKEAFVQQPAKQEAVPRASKQKEAEMSKTKIRLAEAKERMRKTLDGCT